LDAARLQTDARTCRHAPESASALRPTFLLIDRFDEFVRPDEGWSPNANDDAEPTQEWGYSGMRALVAEIRRYRRNIANSQTSNARSADGVTGI
jgi:hypothetical protein